MEPAVAPFSLANCNYTPLPSPVEIPLHDSLHAFGFGPRCSSSRSFSLSLSLSLSSGKRLQSGGRRGNGELGVAGARARLAGLRGIPTVSRHAQTDKKLLHRRPPQQKACAHTSFGPCASASLAGKPGSAWGARAFFQCTHAVFRHVCARLCVEDGQSSSTVANKGLLCRFCDVRPAGSCPPAVFARRILGRRETRPDRRHDSTPRNALTALVNYLWHMDTMRAKKGFVCSLNGRLPRSHWQATGSQGRRNSGRRLKLSDTISRDRSTGSSQHSNDTLRIQSKIYPLNFVILCMGQHVGDLGDRAKNITNQTADMIVLRGTRLRRW